MAYKDAALHRQKPVFEKNLENHAPVKSRANFGAALFLSIKKAQAL